MPQLMHADALGCFGLLDCRSPDLPREGGAAQYVAILVGEDQAIWVFDRELP